MRGPALVLAVSAFAGAVAPWELGGTPGRAEAAQAPSEIQPADPLSRLRGVYDALAADSRQRSLDHQGVGALRAALADAGRELDSEPGLDPAVRDQWKEYAGRLGAFLDENCPPPVREEAGGAVRGAAVRDAGADPGERGRPSAAEEGDQPSGRGERMRDAVSGAIDRVAGAPGRGGSSPVDVNFDGLAARRPGESSLFPPSRDEARSFVDRFLRANPGTSWEARMQSLFPDQASVGRAWLALLTEQERLVDKYSKPEPHNPFLRDTRDPLRRRMDELNWSPNVGQSERGKDVERLLLLQQMQRQLVNIQAARVVQEAKTHEALLAEARAGRLRGEDLAGRLAAVKDLPGLNNYLAYLRNESQNSGNKAAGGLLPYQLRDLQKAVWLEAIRQEERASPWASPGGAYGPQPTRGLLVDLDQAGLRQLLPQEASSADVRRLAARLHGQREALLARFGSAGSREAQEIAQLCAGAADRLARVYHDNAARLASRFNRAAGLTGQSQVRYQEDTGFDFTRSGNREAAFFQKPEVRQALAMIDAELSARLADPLRDEAVHFDNSVFLPPAREGSGRLAALNKARTADGLATVFTQRGIRDKEIGVLSSQDYGKALYEAQLQLFRGLQGYNQLVHDNPRLWGQAYDFWFGEGGGGTPTRADSELEMYFRRARLARSHMRDLGIPNHELADVDAKIKRYLEKGVQAKQDWVNDLQWEFGENVAMWSIGGGLGLALRPAGMVAGTLARNMALGAAKGALSNGAEALVKGVAARLDGKDVDARAILANMAGAAVEGALYGGAQGALTWANPRIANVVFTGMLGPESIRDTLQDIQVAAQNLSDGDYYSAAVGALWAAKDVRGYVRESQLITGRPDQPAPWGERAIAMALTMNKPAPASAVLIRPPAVHAQPVVTGGRDADLRRPVAAAAARHLEGRIELDASRSGYGPQGTFRRGGSDEAVPVALADLRANGRTPESVLDYNVGKHNEAFRREQGPRGPRGIYYARVGDITPEQIRALAPRLRGYSQFSQFIFETPRGVVRVPGP